MTPRSVGLMIAASALVLASCGSSTSSTTSSSGGSVANASPTPLSQQALDALVAKSTVRLTGKTTFGTVGGTGVIIDGTKGYILTNAHVVTGVAALQITFDDKTTSPGRIVAKAPCDDLAVVLVVNKPDKPLPALALGDSSKIAPGDHVTALGYPVSLQETAQEKVIATNGTVSAVDINSEFDPSLPRYVSLIQHQAPINPGNSGGPLVNDLGELIGINTLANTLSGGRAIQGQYYAITTKHIKALLPDLEAGKSANDVGWDLTPNSNDAVAAVESATGQTLPSADGLFVLAVDSGSPADVGKIFQGDAVLSIEGVAVSSFQQVCDILASHGPGQTLTVHEASIFAAAGQYGPGFYDQTITLR